jgi:LPS O-antigen subunit length determinant protein (WzzB/FepE family)
MSYNQAARTTHRQIPRILVNGLLAAIGFVVIIAASAAALGYQLLAPSTWTAASPIGALRLKRRGALTR